MTQDPGLTGDQISALETLAGYPNGCSEAEMKARGFTIGLLGALIPPRIRDCDAGDRGGGGPVGRRGETGDHG
jgi:hypothetical protein